MQPVTPSNFDASSFISPPGSPVLLPAEKSSSLTDNTIPVSQQKNAAAKGSVRVVEIRSLSDLQSIRQAWLNLLEQTPGADFFQTPYWLETYMQHVGDDTELKVLVIYEGAQATGILPLVIAPYQCSLGRFRVLTYPLDWWGTFFGPVGANPDEILRTGLDWIQQQPRDWDFLELRFVNDFGVADSGESDRTLDVLQQVGFGSIVKEPMFHCARIDLSNVTWDEYLAGRRKSWKTNIRRTENKSRKLGEVEHIRFRPEAGEQDPRWDWYEECCRLSRLSWQGKSDNTQTFAHPNVDPFLRALHQRAVSEGCVDMNLLMIDGKAVAYHYGYHFNGYFSSLRLGFDPEFSKPGVGTVLTSRMIQDCIQRGDHTFDFLPDCLKAKLAWQTSVDVGYRYTHFPSSLSRGGLLKLKRWFDRDVRKKTIVAT